MLLPVEILIKAGSIRADEAGVHQIREVLLQQRGHRKSVLTAGVSELFSQSVRTASTSWVP